MKNVKIDSGTKNTLLKIYNDIYTKINQNTIDVFLCGGTSNATYTSTRDKIREGMDEYKDIRILYPEDLFVEMLNKNKEYDLLSLERFLANNCDIICIVCESDGSLVELGAFTNNDETVNKVIAVIEEKRKKDKSFIMLGPIKILRKMNKNQVVFYNENNLNELNIKLQKNFRLNKLKEIREKKKVTNKTLNTITGLYYFIPIMLNFFNSLSVDRISEYLKFLFHENNYGLDDFDTLFRTSLKLLYKDRYISKNIIEGELVYLLTEKGYKNVNNVLNGASIGQKTILYDRIRFAIIKKKYYS
ncbi:MAG: retron St85 family effector protein [Bacillus sp. (in: firmicutes)]|nr:retron St85 family effector protein [Bacillus sp. (in: firmicutes)]